MPEIREQANNCIEKVCFSRFLSLVRYDTRGGNVFLLPGLLHFLREEKVSKTHPKAQGRGTRLLTAAAPPFFYACYSVSHGM